MYFSEKDFLPQRRKDAKFGIFFLSYLSAFAGDTPSALFTYFAENPFSARSLAEDFFDQSRVIFRIGAEVGIERHEVQILDRFLFAQQIRARHISPSI